MRWPQADLDQHTYPVPRCPVQQVPLANGQMQGAQQDVPAGARPLRIDHAPGVGSRERDLVKAVAGVVIALVRCQAGRAGDQIPDALHGRPLPGPPARHRGRGGTDGQVAHGQEIDRRVRVGLAGIGLADGPKYPKGTEAVAGRMVDVEHQDVAARVVGQAGAQRRPFGYRYGRRLELGPDQDEVIVAGAVHDPQHLMVGRPVAQNPSQCRAQPRLFEGSADPRLELQAPRRDGRVQQVVGVGNVLRPVPDPPAIELGPMVTLAAAHEPGQILRHSGQVVGRGPAHRISR